MKRTTNSRASTEDLLFGYLDDQVPALIIASLNRKPSSAIDRVRRLIETIEAAAQLETLIERRSLVVDSLAKSASPKELTGDSEIYLRTGKKLIASVSSILSRYAWDPAVLVVGTRPPSFKLRFAIFMKAGEAPEIAAEYMAVNWIVDHMSEVGRIRRCQATQCRKWFWANVDRQKFCGHACRQFEASQGDAFREKRRIYMKRYRAQQVDRDARALQIIKRRGVK